MSERLLNRVTASIVAAVAIVLPVSGSPYRFRLSRRFLLILALFKIERRRTTAINAGKSICGKRSNVAKKLATITHAPTIRVKSGVSRFHIFI